jgi:hypothetical protein
MMSLFIAGKIAGRQKLTGLSKSTTKYKDRCDALTADDRIVEQRRGDWTAADNSFGLCMGSSVIRPWFLRRQLFGK